MPTKSLHDWHSLHFQPDSLPINFTHTVSPVLNKSSGEQLLHFLFSVNIRRLWIHGQEWMGLDWKKNKCCLKIAGLLCIKKAKQINYHIGQRLRFQTLRFQIWSSLKTQIPDSASKSLCEPKSFNHSISCHWLFLEPHIGTNNHLDLKSYWTYNLIRIKIIFNLHFWRKMCGEKWKTNNEPLFHRVAICHTYYFFLSVLS